MKTLYSWAALVVLCLAMLAPSRASAQVEVSFDYFYDALAPYGTWVEVEGYGPCWSPADVDADWAPYTDGEWVYTDAGWTWQGDEPFSAIVDHYGRWILAGSLGWCWVPGYEWAPAWVSWRDSDDYVGWAPLPPEVAWDPDVGVGTWVDEVYGIGPSFYSFCRHRDFGEHHLRTVIMARSWNTAILVKSRNITHMAFHRNLRLIFAGGLDLERARRFASSQIRSLHLECRNDYDFRGARSHALLPGGLVVGNNLVVVAPRILPMSSSHPVRPETHKVIAHSQVNHGWVGKGASGNLDSVRHQIHIEAQGRTPKSDPVRPLVVSNPPVVPLNAGPIPLQPQPTAQPVNQAADRMEQDLARARQLEAEALARNQAVQVQQPRQVPIIHGNGLITRDQAAQVQQQRNLAVLQANEAAARNQTVQGQQQRSLAVLQQNEAALTRQQTENVQRERERTLRQQGAEAMARRQAQEQEQRQNQVLLERQHQEQARTEIQQRAAVEASHEHARQLEFQRRVATPPPPAPTLQSSSVKSRDDDDHKKKR